MTRFDQKKKKKSFSSDNLHCLSKQDSNYFLNIRRFLKHLDCKLFQCFSIFKEHPFVNGFTKNRF